ncbi:hypothetical protein LIER_36819 [Lithospermum erythrorhizon]|uniref:Uncharacterized protein n=1 Tax=Lithospermum erythrorhizon TaxID=34254 RepID=A0AAV3PFS2_LITER
MSFLIFSLSKETIPLAVGKQSSRAIWVALKIASANPSFSSHLCLQDKLINLKQNNLPIAAYLQQAKTTYDALAAMGKQPPHDVFLICILKGLHLHTPVEPSSSGILPTPPPTAQFSSRDQGHFRDRGRSSRGHFARGSGRHSSNDRKPSTQSHWHSSADQHKSRCFICESILHLANSCPHRSNAPQANYAAPAYQSNSYTPSFVSSYAPWVPDTGASYYVSPDLAAFLQPEVYNGADCLQVANGPGYPSPSAIRNE